MESPTEEDFKESIKELSDYKNRLEKEVEIISKKLKMPQEKIKYIINSHEELNQINKILLTLKREKENITKNWEPQIQLLYLNITKINAIKPAKTKFKLIYFKPLKWKNQTVYF